MTELKIIAVVSVKPEFKQEIVTSIQSLVEVTRKEEGNISYDLNENVENKNELVILETWKSQDAIDFHNSTAHFEKFKKDIEGKIDNLKIDIIKKIY